MEKVQATALRPGMVVLYNDQPHRILSFQHRTPGKGNAVVQIKLRGDGAANEGSDGVGVTESRPR